MSLREVVTEHARFRRRLALAVAAEAADLWRQVDPARIAASWTSAILRLTVILTGAQRAVAGRSDTYLDEVLAAQDVPADAAGRVDAGALAGVASDGRALGSLLYRPAVATLVGISRGSTVEQALGAGGAVLERIVRTQIADAGRAADQVAVTARPQVTGYVRMLVGRSCSRCVILAGRNYGWNSGFRRHPACDCIHVPARENTADDLRTNPRQFFESLSQAEQDRVFTKAAAEAIRLGSDLSQVVNAGRGMHTATDGRQFTTEAAGRRSRLMPEQILREANGDRGEAIRLLRLHRYLS